MRGLKPLAGVLLLSFACGTAWAGTDEEIFRDFRFNFIIPGARSLGLGGAFIAAADDTTAIEANPAALHYVSRFEFFVEYRDVEEVSRFNTGSSGDATPTGMVDFFGFNTVFEAEQQNIPSFVSFAVPFRLGKKRHRARLAFSRQVILAEENSIGTANPIDFQTDTSLCSAPGARCTSLDYSLISFPLLVVNGPGGPTVERYSINNQVTGRLEADLVHYNLGGSLTLGQNFSLGMTVTLADLTVRSDVTSLTNDPRGLITSVHPRVDVDGVASDIRSTTRIDDTDSELTYTFGFLWHPDSVFNGRSPLRMGVVYRKGADLAVTQTSTEFNAQTMAFEADPNNGPFENAFKVPDRWGVGFVWEGQHWKYSFDLERILYSDQLDDFRAGENFFTSNNIPDLTINNLVYTVDDATIPHAGIEYAFTSGGGNWTQAIRMGYYLEADNQIRLQSIEIDHPDPVLRLQREQFFLDLFGGGEDVDHVTIGFSIGTPAGIELQFAGDFSENNDVLLASAIVRFGKRR